MDKGTFETVVESQYEGVGKSYYKFKVTTNWNKTEDGEKTVTSWSTKVIAIDRDGSEYDVTQPRMLKVSWSDDQVPFEYQFDFDTYAPLAGTDESGHAFYGRRKALDAHTKVIILVMG